MPYAHSRNTRGRRHGLVAHLQGVADLAARFAADFGAADLAHALGLWHDLGKFDPAFQSYLLASEQDQTARRRGPDHKAAGVQLVRQHSGGLTALILQGHHGGLKTPNDLRNWFVKHASNTGEALMLARRALPTLDPPAPLALPGYARRNHRAAEFFLRMLFSALVDADFLDTEQHFRDELTAQRGGDVTLADLWERFERDQQRFSAVPAGEVVRARQAIYAACLAAAEQPPGLFRLTVPTGGGKTRSGMAFGLRHALRHDLRRVIVAVPFITITEQTAGVYRDMFGADDHGRPVVLEHHSAAVELGDPSDDFDPRSIWMRLAAENWDAPVIVTTTVQLFESLFANGTSRCRKLHRLARSVIILDEAQSLPPRLLTPILDALRELCAHYGTTVVLSTATQPAFEAIPVFRAAPATEIVPEPARFFNALARVSYDWSQTRRSVTWPEVAGWLRDEPQALAVLNTKKDALTLLDALGDPDALHLSTLLCGAHRARVLEEVKRRLAAGEHCRLISTQVVEAGVDLDFPLVLRALGPLDAVIQAAGRCNREGRLERGRVIVFRPADGGMPRGPYETAAQTTVTMLGDGTLDLDDPAILKKYFKLLYDVVATDAEEIQKWREVLDYPQVARRFRMIADDTESVVVPYGSKGERREVQSILDRLASGAPEARLLLRRLQPYLVSVRRHEADRYRQRGFISEVLPGLGVWGGVYDSIRGLMAEDVNPDTLVV